MDAKQAASDSARKLLAGSPSAGERERAAKLLELSGADAKGAWAETGRSLEEMAAAAVARGDAAEAVPWLLEGAEAFVRAGDTGGVRRAAEAALGHWEAFAGAKEIVVERGTPASNEGRPAPKLRRLPGARRDGPPEAPGPAPPAAAGAELPTMFLEMRARLLRLAGREDESAKAYSALMDAVAREVARRRREQQWQEALAAARSWLKAGVAAGGRPRLDAIRPEFVSLAREAAAEAATPEYFVRGHDEVPAQAMADALVEAHALGNESFAAKYDAELADVLERTAEVLESLTSRRTAAEALLSSEHEWPMIAARRGARKRLLDVSDGQDDFGEALGIGGLAPSHPLRAEVEEFGVMLEAAVGRAVARTPDAYMDAAAALLPSNPQRALQLAATAAGRLLPVDRRHLRALRLQRDARIRKGDREGAAVAQEALVRATQTAFDSDEGGHRLAVEQAEYQAALSGEPKDDQLARGARASLAGWLSARGASRYREGDRGGARALFEEASGLGDREAERWLQVMALAPGK